MLDTVLDTGELNEHSPDWRNVFTGLLGGYQVYEHVACAAFGMLFEAFLATGCADVPGNVSNSSVGQVVSKGARETVMCVSLTEK